MSLSAGPFYGGQNFWAVPDTRPLHQSGSAASQPPYYLTMTMPGEAKPSSRWSRPHVSGGRPNMAAFMAVNSNPRAARLRHDRDPPAAAEHAIPGPQQANNTFESDPRPPQLSRCARTGPRSARQPDHAAARRRPALRPSRSTSRPSRRAAPTRSSSTCSVTGRPGRPGFHHAAGVARQVLGCRPERDRPTAPGGLGAGDRAAGTCSRRRPTTPRRRRPSKASQQPK